MLYNLVEELMKREYQVTLFASGDSKTSAEFVSVVEKGLWLQHGIRNLHAPVIRLIKMVVDRLHDFDIIHNHFNFFTFPVSLRRDCPPFLTTVHRPMDEYYAETIKAYPKVKLCALSEDHRQSIEEYGVSVIDVIPNGIDPAHYEYNCTPEDYLLYLGRLNREKGVITAIEVAKSAGENLVVAGNVVGGEEWSYFLHEVQPRLNDEHIRFVGQVGFEEKARLLKNAKALLFPIDRREPFGLVMIEAMACGTPVIAFREGSTSEIVEDGKTGFVVDTREEMIEAVKHLSSIDRNACRKSVEERFSLRQMVDAYQYIYEKIVA